tara:strand:- start:530 stop:655 length:126 start_codon:yes stop_codon:yes gene_type:complete
MKHPNVNVNNQNYNTLNFEPSDEDLKKIEQEVDKLLHKDRN